MHLDNVFFLFLHYISVFAEVDLSDRVIHAINCGGNAIIGAYGISYNADTLYNGETSDYGRRYAFMNAPRDDAELYMTERYSTNVEGLTYTFRLEDGKYTLWLKFSEVYFSEPNKKVFDVYLNDDIKAIDGLDIFYEAGGVGLAHDRYVDFTVKNGELRSMGDKTAFDRKLRVSLVPLPGYDNPKINAIAILRGPSRHLPTLPSPGLPDVEEYNDDNYKTVEKEEDIPRTPPMKKLKKVPDPYELMTDYSTLIIVSVLVVVIPMTFFLRKL